MSDHGSGSGNSSRLRWGGLAWLLSGLILPLQLLVALQWPSAYSITGNAISDLGVTACGPFADGGEVRAVCSPWHGAFNAGLVVSGLLIVIGSVLLHGRWRRGSGRWGMVLMALTGVLLVVVGFAPWDLHADLHDGAALGQAVAQWIAMILLALAAGPGAFRRITIAVVVVSALMFAAFLAALEGSPLPGLSLGVSERLAFDSLALWVALAGVAQLLGRPRGGLEPGGGVRRR